MIYSIRLVLSHVSSQFKLFSREPLLLGHCIVEHHCIRGHCAGHHCIGRHCLSSIRKDLKGSERDNNQPLSQQSTKRPAEKDKILPYLFVLPNLSPEGR